MISNVTVLSENLTLNLTCRIRISLHIKVRFAAEVDSISTNNEQRDGHLKSVDFFDTGKNPILIICQH